MNILITLCARGGSKGIPGKNIKLLNGKPLIAYTIDIAKAFSLKFNCKIALSTDDSKIKDIAAEFGLETSYSRPADLSTDQAGKIGTINDLLKHEEKLAGLEYDYVLDLDVTSPLRTLQDLESAFSILANDPDALNLFSVNKAARNPYFNMVERQDDGYFKLVKDKGSITGRQSAPEVFDLNASFYFYRRDFFRFLFPTVFTPRSLVYVMPHICFDLDHLIDFVFLEFLLSNNKLEFELC
jgi:CMP-N,N'-diacetyllegionaminic acid synthase